PSGGWGMACNACAGVKQKCRGREVERLERLEKKKARAMRTKWSRESEEERVALWVPQAPGAEEELINMVRAMHNLVMHGVSELEEWRKEARADWRSAVVDQKLLREVLRSLGEKVMVEK